MRAMNRFGFALAAALGVVLACASALSAGADRPASPEAVRAAQSTPAPSRPAAPVVLKWTTKSEVNTAGFNIYRSEDRSGPWAQINADLIPASNDAIAGGQYAYTDTTSYAGITYYYYLEDIETNGRRTQHDPFMITAGASAASSSFMQPVVIAAVAVAAAGLLGAIVWRMRRS